jgi:hypothetical protein
MEFTDLQMTLTVVVVLTAAALVIFYDYRKKQRQQQQQVQRVKTSHAARPASTSRLFDTAPLEYASAKRLAAERPLEPKVEAPLEPQVTRGISRHPDAPAPERGKITIQVTDPTSNGSSFSTTVQLPAITIDGELWERLIASRPKNNLLVSADAQQEAPAVEAPVRRHTLSANTVDASFQVVAKDNPTGVPSGMIQQPVLQKLLENREPFTGLVISIGINDADSNMWHSQGLMQSVGNYVTGLLKPNEFSCRTAYDEFVMVCCGEQGAQSQRRLNQISEKLWDFQLRGVGACAILFSWGGVQVHNQPLADAVTSAAERMRQTKRSGRPPAAVTAQKQAV